MFKISPFHYIKAALASALFIPNAFSSALPNNDQTIFSCDTENGGRIVLSSIGESIEYKFERLGVENPDLYLLKNKASVLVDVRDGEDDGIKYFAADLPNGDYTYRALFGRYNNERAVGIGVYVLKGENLIDKVYCSNFKNTKNESNKQSDKIDSIEEGTYRVGIDIPEGEYRLKVIKSDGLDLGGFYRVYTDSSNKLNSIVTGDSFKNVTFITLKKGQYFEMSRATAEKVK